MAGHDEQSRIADFIAKFESLAAEELRSRQSTQSFDGTLRIDLNRVFVSRSEGDRIIRKLDEIDPAQVHCAR